MKPVKTIRDPIHGTITLNEIELELIDTPEFQRLRRIKQNGLCYLVYPAMNSTRFEHSLGVMYLAGRMAEHLELDNDNREILRVAALLHDIGHCAFSHTSDDILIKGGDSHEKNSSRIIMKSEISDILKNHGINPVEISGLANGEGNLGKIISSEIDIDKMDYLIRDSYYAGVAYGVIDLERIIYGVKMVDGEIFIKRGSIEAVESLLISRNLMYQTVYRHHTKRIVESMFRHAIDSLIKKGIVNYGEFIRMDDIDLIHALRNAGGYPGEIMNRIDNRRLFKTVFQGRMVSITENFRRDMAEKSMELEKKIAEDFGIDDGYLLLDIPGMKMPEFKILIESDNGSKFIDEISNLARALEKAEEEKLTLCIYTNTENREKMKEFNAERYIEFSQTRLRKFI